MDLYQYLGKFARGIDTLDTAKKINDALDELDRIQDMLDPEFQGAVDQLIQQLTEKLRDLE